MQTSDTEIIEQLIHDLTNQVEINRNANCDVKISGAAVKIKADQFRENFLDSSSSDSSSDSSTSSFSSDSDTPGAENENKKKKTFGLKTKPKSKTNDLLALDHEEDSESEENRTQTTQKYLKTKGELTIDDLQPVAQLSINLDDSIKLIKMGTVISIVDDKLVVIQSIMNESQLAKPLDEETILFDSNRKCLGKIFEVFGPVTSPFYSIRFNNSKEIKDNCLIVQKGNFIFYAPDSTELTKFIFNVDDLRRVKGSDASWNHDNEPPAENLEYSDDEKEQQAKRLLKQNRKAYNDNLDADSSDSGTVDELDSINKKKAKTGNNFANKSNKNNRFQRSKSGQGFHQNNSQTTVIHNQQRSTMTQSRSEFNFQGNLSQNSYPLPHPYFNQQMGQMSNQYMQPQQFYSYPPPQPMFNNWANPQQHNSFMNFPQMPYNQNLGYNFMTQNQMLPPPHMQQQFNTQNREQVSNNSNSNNNNNLPNIVDRRFIQNKSSKIIKKSF